MKAAVKDDLGNRLVIDDGITGYTSKCVSLRMQLSREKS